MWRIFLFKFYLLCDPDVWRLLSVLQLRVGEVHFPHLQSFFCTTRPSHLRQKIGRISKRSCQIDRDRQRFVQLFSVPCSPPPVCSSPFSAVVPLLLVGAIINQSGSCVVDLFAGDHHNDVPVNRSAITLQPPPLQLSHNHSLTYIHTLRHRGDGAVHKDILQSTLTQIRTPSHG